MDVRFCVTQKSLVAAGLRIAYSASGSPGIYEGVSGFIRIAALTHVGTQFYFDDTEIADERLWPAVVKMSIRKGEKFRLVYGTYEADKWSASIEPNESGSNKSMIELVTKRVMPVKEFINIYRELASGSYLPSFVVKDQALSSAQVEELVMKLGHVDLPHWLSIIQGAQDVVVKSVTTINQLKRQVAQLETMLQDHRIDPMTGIRTLNLF